MARYKTRTEQRAASKKRRAMVTVVAIALLATVGGAWFIKERNARLALGNDLCPPQPVSVTAVLVDVTDPMTLPQRQDLRNKLEELKSSVPRYGKIAIFKVDTSKDQLLSPVLQLCNPGNANSVTDINGDPAAMQARWDQQFQKPLDKAFQGLMQASGSDTSPILQSMQSVNLTELKNPVMTDKPRKLIVISDLLQNTSGLSFYHQLPDASEVEKTSDFSTARTDLHGIDVELWMLQRPDFASTQPRALADLWDALVTAEGGQVTTVYRVSG